MRFFDLIRFFKDEDKKRHYIISSGIIVIMVLAIISLGFVLSYINGEKIEYKKYKESSDIDYKVNLNKNKFYDTKFLSTDKKYIASLIKNIEADFKYEIETYENVNEYAYSYNIDAVVDVFDRDDKKSIYTTNESIVDEKNGLSNYENNVNINEKLKIDYGKYNDLISDFKDVYDLDSFESTLTINMYVKIADSKENLNNTNKKLVQSLEIPLTRKTVEINITEDKGNNTGIALFIKSKNANLKDLIVAGVIFVLDMFLGFVLYKYYINTKTDENIYSDKLRKILYSYKGYIQKIDNTEMNFTEYQSVYLDSFNDLIEIRDTLQEPILMLENKQKTEVNFFILSNTKILYIYWLGTDIVRKRLGTGMATVSNTNLGKHSISGVNFPSNENKNDDIY